MKAYLATTGILFGLIAAMHVWRSVEEFSHLSTDPVYYLGMSSLGVVAAALSIWAWRLVYSLSRRADDKQDGG